jgi:beta-galactosidase
MSRDQIQTLQLPVLNMELTEPRTRTLFDEGWKFHLGSDVAPPRRLVGKAGTANGWSDLSEEELMAYNGERSRIEKMGPSFQAVQLRPHDNDASWTDIKLPHDWRIEQLPSPSQQYASDYPKIWQGFWPTGVAYYRKIFTTSPHQHGQHVYLTFDGIAGNSDIWLNGFWIGNQSTSYTPLTLDVTEMLRFGIPNVLLVRSDSSEAEGWWLEGGGIYRHVWIEQRGDVQITQDGIYVTAKDVSDKKATINVELSIANLSLSAVDATVSLLIVHPSGEHVPAIPEDKASSLNLQGMSTSTVKKEITIDTPELWCLGKGSLYSLTVYINQKRPAMLLDQVDLQFGIRNIEWEEDGVVINGLKSKIFGVNLHQDFGFYGSALPDRIIEAKMDMCAEMGANAVRIAHHAPTPELVRHADRIGMLILPEQRNMSTSSASIQQLRNMVRKFRSNPSVFMWSLENEELSLQGTAVGSAILARLIKECRSLDPTRPITLGGVVSLDDDSAGYYRQLDVVGMHYRCLFGNLDQTITLHTNKLLILDEEGLFASTRGVYHYDKKNAYSGSFSYIHEALLDRDEPQSNAAIGDIDPLKFSPFIAPNLSLAFSHPKVTGSFIWTGIDYYGEPTPARWPSVVGACGQRDLAGLPKDYYWLVRSIFKEQEPIVHGFPHWTWPGKEGQSLSFAVYSNCDEVEIEVNGVVSGPRLPIIDHKAQQPQGIVYQAGNVCVRGFKNGMAVAEHIQETAGAPFELRLLPDRTELNSSGKDIALVRICVVDAKGCFVPYATDLVQVSAKGPGRVSGMCNGDTSFSKYLRPLDNAPLFNGQAVVFVEGGVEEGELEIEASAVGIQTATTILKVSSKLNHGHYLSAHLDEKAISVHGVYRNPFHDDQERA